MVGNLKEGNNILSASGNDGAIRLGKRQLGILEMRVVNLWLEEDVEKLRHEIGIGIVAIVATDHIPIEVGELLDRGVDACRSTEKSFVVALAAVGVRGILGCWSEGKERAVEGGRLSRFAVLQPGCLDVVEQWLVTAEDILPLVVLGEGSIAAADVGRNLGRHGFEYLGLEEVKSFRKLCAYKACHLSEEGGHEVRKTGEVGDCRGV